MAGTRSSEGHGSKSKVQLNKRVLDEGTGTSLHSQLNRLLQREKARNDVVLKEFPVFLSKTLQKELSLIQYPQRPSSVSTQNMEILETKIKPGQKKLQLTLGLDPESELYDPESAELLAEAAAGLGLDEDEYMPDHRLRLDKTTLESTDIPKLAEMSRYAIGVLRRGSLTLTPITSIVQMKPVFPYLNSADKARSAYARSKAGGPPDPEDAEAESSEAEKVTVKFSRAGGPAGPSSRPTSSYLARKKEEEEPWVELDYVLKDSAEFEKLYTSSASSPFYVLNKSEYLDSLFPKHFETSADGGTPVAQNLRISVVAMKSMPISEQLKVLLSNAKVMQYNQIVEFMRTKLSCEFDDVSLLKSIQIVAILVQGCWVVKSEVLYGEDYKSGCNGISGPIMQRGRDAILSQFTEHRYVDRKKMGHLTKLPSEEVSEILTQVSVLVRGKGWEFALPYDTNFLGKYPEVVERQSLIWQMKKQQRIRHSSTGMELGGGNSPPRRRKSRNKSISSSGDESGPESGEGYGARRRGSVGVAGRRRISEQSDREGTGTVRQRRNSRNVVGSKVET